MFNKRKFKIFILALVSIFFVSAKPTSAFSVAPVKILLTVNKGASQTIVVKIKNDEKQDFNFKLGVTGVRQDEAGNPFFEAGINEAESWVYPENNLVKIKSGETKSVNFIVKIPADALAGSRYLGLTVEPILEKTGQSDLKTKLISLLTLQVQGLVEESVVVEKWDPLAGVVGEKNWKFNLGLKNNGTMEVLLRGEAVIKNWKGDDIFSQPIVLGNKLLAGSKRALQPEIILKNNISLPGIYQAQIKITYGRTNQTVSALAYVWYFPKWSKVALITGGLLLVLAIILALKRPKRVKI